MKADLEMCPPWILSKLKTERDLRRKLAEQTKEQTRILLEEVKDWRAKAYNYQREAQEKEAQRKKKQEELDRIKEMAVKAITQLQQQLGEKDDQLQKKNEILALLKQRFLQFQEAKKEAQTVQQPPAPSLSSSWDSTKSAGNPSSVPIAVPSSVPIAVPSSPPTGDRLDQHSDKLPGQGAWEAAAAKSSGPSVRPSSPTRGLVAPSVESLSASTGTAPTAGASSGVAGSPLSSSGSSLTFNISGQRLHSSSVSANSPPRLPSSPTADKRHTQWAGHSRAPRPLPPAPGTHAFPGTVIGFQTPRSAQKEDIFSQAEAELRQEGSSKPLSSELQKQITELMGRRAEAEHEDKEPALTPEQLRVLLAQPDCRKNVITELCLNEDLQMVLALCDCVDMSSLAELTKCLVNFFLNHGQLMRLLEGIIKYEIARTLEIGTLFRSNSVAAKVMGHFIRLCGRQYLLQLLAPLLKELAVEDRDLEIDSFRNELAEDMVQQHVGELGAICTKFLQRIDSMVDQCPLQFRIICNLLHTETKLKFPDLEWPIATGGFFFLRYICPAIVAPETIMPEFASLAKGPNVRRTLVLLTKTMQNLANGTRFFKEPFMMSMVPWIDEHLPQCKAMFLDLSTVIPEGMVESPVCPDQDMNEAIAGLNDHLNTHKQAFLKSLSENHNDQQTLRVSVRTADQVHTVLHKVGKPSPSLVSKEHEAALAQLTHMLLDDKQLFFPISLAATAQQTAEDSAGKEKHDWSVRVAEALMTVFEAHDCSAQLLREQFKKEHFFENPDTMDSAMSMKMFAAYVRLTCRPYLAGVLGPLIGPIVQKNVNYDVEDGKGSGTLQETQQQIVTILRGLCESIINSLQFCPTPLLEHLVYVQEQSRKKGKNFSVCRFLLTSVILPAIKNPHLFEIVRDPPKKEAQKTLDTLEKIMGYIADATTGEVAKSLGKNEAMLKALSVLNEFITASARTFQAFFAETLLSSIPHSERYPASVVPLHDALQGPKALSTIYGFIYEHTSAITKAVGSRETSLTIEYRMREIFDVLLDPAQEGLAFKEKKRDKERHRKATSTAAAAAAEGAKKKFSRLFG